MSTDIIEKFVSVATQQPDRTAVSDGPRQVSYRELMRLVDRIASELAQRTAEPRVLICMPRGVEAYASILGALAAGGYFCPINLELPARRIDEVCNQFRPNIVLASTQWFKDHLPQVDKSLFCDPALVGDSSLDPKTVRTNRIAYVIFTSGSTGRPKGVVIPRSAASHFAHVFSELIDVSSNDRWAQFSNLGFDLSLVDIFSALTCGATLVPVYRPHQRMFPATFIRDEGITIWHSVPSVIDLMAHANQITPQHLGSLRIASFCGEPLRQQHLAMLFKANQSLVAYNAYGPTETTMFCTAQRLVRQDFEGFCNASVSIGSPLPGWDIELSGGANLDEGEIIIIGDHIGMGYFNDKALSDASYQYLDGLKVGDQPRRSYRTGDWAERSDGKLYFRKRIDRQVKVSGHRLELGEVEHHLRNVTSSHCCVFLDEQGLLAVVEADDNVDEERIFAELRLVLPSYAIPKRIFALSRIPRNLNDKTDIAAVKEMAIKWLMQGPSNNER